MIFMALGTEKYPFDRPLKIMDEAVKSGIIKEKVIVQSNTLNFKPVYCEHVNIMPYIKFIEVVSQSVIYICHGGIGSIMTGFNFKKKPIVIPRYVKYGENVDDHQIEITLKLAEENLIIPCLEGDDLLEKIKNFSEAGQNYDNSKQQMLFRYLEEELS